MKKKLLLFQPKSGNNNNIGRKIGNNVPKKKHQQYQCGNFFSVVLEPLCEYTSLKYILGSFHVNIGDSDDGGNSHGIPVVEKTLEEAIRLIKSKGFDQREPNAETLVQFLFRDHDCNPNGRILQIYSRPKKMKDS